MCLVSSGFDMDRRNACPTQSLHAFVVGTATALGDDPVDNLVGIGDVAGLAVHAIRSVDFQLRWAAGFFHHFIDRGGTKILAGIAVFDDAFRGTSVGVGNAQMAGLILLVARPRVVDVGKAIESELTIAFEAFGPGAAVDFFVGFVARMGAHGIDQAAAAGDLLKRGVKESAQHTVLKRLVKIANLPELFLDVALFDFLGEGAQHFA